MTLMIKTAQGWLPVVDNQSIKPRQRAGESIVRNDVFLNWSPSPLGKESGQFAHEHNELVALAGQGIDHGIDRTDSIQLAMLKRNLISNAQATNQLARHAALAV
jgi:hypothetical protein